MNPANAIYLFTVAERVVLDGPGLVFFPGIPHERSGPAIHRGDPLLLRTPLGEILRTTLRDFQMIRVAPDSIQARHTPISLPREIHKFDVPLGTEVYLDPAVATTSSAPPVGS